MVECQVIRTKGNAMSKRKPIKLARQDYQPTKAEQEEQTVLRKADGSVPTPAEVMRALTRPVEIEYVEKPKTR